MLTLYASLFFMSIYLPTNLGAIAHNVSAVYDIFAVATKEREAFQQLQKCGGGLPWEWSEAE
jgi:hypothetical protein